MDRARLDLAQSLRALEGGIVDENGQVVEDDVRIAFMLHRLRGWVDRAMMPRFPPFARAVEAMHMNHALQVPLWNDQDIVDFLHYLSGFLLTAASDLEEGRAPLPRARVQWMIELLGLLKQTDYEVVDV